MGCEGKSIDMDDRGWMVMVGERDGGKGRKMMARIDVESERMQWGEEV